MDEREEATRFANAVLDSPGEDPDSDISVLARQFLRAIDRIEALTLSDGDVTEAMLVAAFRAHEATIGQDNFAAYFTAIYTAMRAALTPKDGGGG